MHVTKSGPAKIIAAFDLISDALPFARYTFSFSSERKCLTADLFGIKTTPPFALWLIWLIARPASMVQRRNSY